MHISDLTAFVYGTLKPGGRYWPEFCAGKVAPPVATKVRGELHDMGLGFPGLVLKGSDWVHGYLLTFRERSDFLRLDELEGYAPNRPPEDNEYTRLRLPCFSPDDDPLGEAWAYEITPGMMARCCTRRIPDGNWPV